MTEPDLHGQVGALLTAGPSDWQIIQQDEHGVGRLELAGRWVGPGPGRIEARLVEEATGAPVSAHLDWRPAATRPDGTWTAALEGIPAGGLYRLETRFNPDGNLAGEWSARGDMRHFLGVGDLWVITGQSNSAGYGREPVDDPPELGVHLFGNAMRWGLAAHPLNESTRTRHAVNLEGSNPGHAPHLHFARLLKRRLGHPIGLVQASRGGSSLAEWTPGEPPNGGLFRNLLRVVAAAGGRVRGLVWYQGETESDGALGAHYLGLFARALAAWREHLGQPDLPVLTVQLNRHYIPATEALERSWSQTREAQRQAARSLPHVFVTPASDLPLSDGIHTSAAGNLLLAGRLARAALGGVYGQPVDFAAPDLQAARTDGDRLIRLTFAPVTSRMDNVNPLANCFAVEDALGRVPVAQVTYPGGAEVRLELGRALSGPALVHGGYGLAPDAAPMDMERGLPMLSFYGAPVA